MRWSSLKFEIEWFFKMNWEVLLLVVVMICGGLGSYYLMKDYKPPPEQIEIEAEGEIENIRNTGAWNIYDTEVKFTDGSIILLKYSTVRHYKLKRGLQISVIYSSRRGRIINLLGDLK